MQRRNNQTKIVKQKDISQVAGLELLKNPFPRYELGDILADDGSPLEKNCGVYPEFHQKGDKPIAVVSDRYEIVNHDDVFRSLYDVIQKENYTVKSVRLTHTPDYHKAFATLMFDNYFDVLRDAIAKGLVKKGDVVQWGLQIGNGVDGRMSLIAVPFSLQLSCTNGATATHRLHNLKFRHTGIDLEDLIDTIRNVVGSFANLSDRYREWVEQPIIEMKQLNEESGLWVANNFPNYMLDAVKTKNPKTAWELFDVLTYENTHAGNRSEYTKLNFNNQIYRLIELVSA